MEDWLDYEESWIDCIYPPPITYSESTQHLPTYLDDYCFEGTLDVDALLREVVEEPRVRPRANSASSTRSLPPLPSTPSEKTLLPSAPSERTLLRTSPSERTLVPAKTRQVQRSRSVRKISPLVKKPTPKRVQAKPSAGPVKPKVALKLNPKTGPAKAAKDPPEGKEGADMAVVSIANLSNFAPAIEKEPGKTRLVFNADFEAGNLGRVDAISKSEYDLYVRPDTSSPQHRLWFHFTVVNHASKLKTTLNIINLSKQKSLFSEGMTPVIRRGKTKKNWERMDPTQVQYWKSPLHDQRFILTLSVDFAAGEELELAYNFPYSYGAIRSYLGKLSSKSLPFLRVDHLAQTLQGRTLDLLTITSVDNLVGAGKQRIIFVTARVHPGESPSSLVVQGLIDHLLGSSTEAETLRRRFVWKIIPCLNPDGVALGNYRCSLMGFDLNRHWQTPSSWAHPTVFSAKRTLLQYYRNNQMDLVLYLDLHAHSTRYGAFMYGNVFSTEAKRCERQLLLPILLAQESDDFSLDSTNFNTDTCKTGTGRRTMGGSLKDSCLCYTLEVSFHGYRSNRPKARPVVVPYTTALYERLGLNLAQAILRFSAVEIGEETAPTPPRPYATFLSPVKKSNKSFRLHNPHKLLKAQKS